MKIVLRTEEKLFPFGLWTMILFSYLNHCKSEVVYKIISADGILNDDEIESVRQRVENELNKEMEIICHANDLEKSAQL